MKKTIFYTFIFILFLSILFFSFSFQNKVPSFFDNITGTYIGNLSVGSSDLRLVLIVSKDLFKANELNAILISPDQSSALIPSSSFSYNESTITFAFSSIKASITILDLVDNKIKATFIQSSKKFDLNLTKIPRPQEPKIPLNYQQKEVEISNNEITLNGTLTIPENKDFAINEKFPAIILITGSGAQNRDEEIFGHKPFFVLSDFLTNLGFVVLRVDDRGVGKDINIFTNSTTFDFFNDCIAQVNYLKSLDFIDKSRIGLLGHSEGGLISYIAAASYPEDISFIISLAGPSQRGDKLLLAQQELIARASGMKEKDIKKMLEINSAFFEIIIKYKDDPATENLINELKELARKFKLSKQETDQAVATLTAKWMRTFISLDPADYLNKIKCPTLALFGEKDLQVPWKANSEIMKSIFDSTEIKNYFIYTLPSHNHLFQIARTGNIDEYGLIQQTISEQTLGYIKEFLNKIIKSNSK